MTNNSLGTVSFVNPMVSINEIPASLNTVSFVNPMVNYKTMIEELLSPLAKVNSFISTFRDKLNDPYTRYKAEMDKLKEMGRQLSQFTLSSEN